MAREQFGVQKKRIDYLGLTWLIFGLVLVAELVGAYILIYKNHFQLADAMSRTANAYYTLYLKPAKLSSIGFIWNPLPSLLQIPILLFAGRWRSLATLGLSGSIMNAIFAAVNAVILFRCFKHYKIETAVSFAAVLLYAFNPFIFYYGCNGMSETSFFTAVIACVFCFIRWADVRQTKDIAIIAFSLGLSFLIRYESLALALAVLVCLVITVFFMRDKTSPFDGKKTPKMKRSYFTASGTVLFLPIIYFILMWVIINWMIMGDPLYFLDSSYSNTAQSAVLYGYTRLESHLPKFLYMLWYSLVRMLPFLLPFAVLTVSRMATRRLFRSDYLLMLMFIGAFAGFHYILLLTGASFGWLRFFSFSLPVSMALFPYELSQLQKTARRRTVIGLLMALALSAVIIPNYYFKSFDLAPEEYEAFNMNDYNTQGKQRELAEIINEDYADSIILVDSFTTGTMIVGLDHPENLITNVSEDFMEAVDRPWSFGVQYIVVPRSAQGVGTLDAINKVYPNLEQEEWCILVEDIDYFYIYKVLY